MNENLNDTPSENPEGKNPEGEAPKEQKKGKEGKAYSIEEVQALIALEVEKTKDDLLKNFKTFTDGDLNIDNSKKLDKPILFITKRLGLKIIIEPHRSFKRDGGLHSVKGRYIQFVNGKFYAQTQDELEAIKRYMKRNSDVHEMTEADKEFLKARARVMNNDGEKNKAFEKIFLETKGRQGAVG